MRFTDGKRRDRHGETRPRNWAPPNPSPHLILGSRDHQSTLASSERCRVFAGRLTLRGSCRMHDAPGCPGSLWQQATIVSGSDRSRLAYPCRQRAVMHWQKDTPGASPARCFPEGSRESSAKNEPLRACVLPTPTSVFRSQLSDCEEPVDREAGRRTDVHLIASRNHDDDTWLTP